MVTDGVPPENCRIIAAVAETFDSVDITWSMRTANADTVEVSWRVTDNVDSGPDPDHGYVFQARMVDGIYRFLTVNNYDFIDQEFDEPHNDNVWRKYRIYSRSTRHRAKWWLATDPEPPFWNIDVIDDLYTSGRVFIGMWNNDAEVVATTEWDELHIEEILPPPPGIYLPNEMTEAVYIGESAVVTAYVGDEEIGVP